MCFLLLKYGPTAFHQIIPLCLGAFLATELWALSAQKPFKGAGTEATQTHVHTEAPLECTRGQVRVRCEVNDYLVSTRFGLDPVANLFYLIEPATKHECTNRAECRARGKEANTKLRKKSKVFCFLFANTQLDNL